MSQDIHNQGGRDTQRELISALDHDFSTSFAAFLTEGKDAKNPILHVIAPTALAPVSRILSTCHDHGVQLNIYDRESIELYFLRKKSGDSTFVNTKYLIAERNDHGKVLCALYEGSAIAEQVLGERLLSFGVFGSFSNGTEKISSDVDVFLVVDDSDNHGLVEPIAKIRSIVDTEINSNAEAVGTSRKFEVVVLSVTDLIAQVSIGSLFVTTVLRYIILLSDKSVTKTCRKLLISGRIKPSPEAYIQYKKMYLETKASFQSEVVENAVIMLVRMPIILVDMIVILDGKLIHTVDERIDYLETKYCGDDGPISNATIGFLRRIRTWRKLWQHDTQFHLDLSEIYKFWKDSEKPIRELELMSLRDISFETSANHSKS